MPRSYQHISKYEKEILELKAQGLTQKEIGAKLGFTKEQVHNFISRYNEKQRKLMFCVKILLGFGSFARYFLLIRSTTPHLAEPCSSPRR